MRITKFVITLSAVLMLAGCADTYHGAVYNVRDNFHWLQGDKSDMEKKWGKVPTGYSGHNPHGPILKPKPAQEALVWNEVGTYEGAPVAVDQGPVTVYPVDGQPVEYAGYPQETAYVDYGQLLQQIYFDHGSSAISAADRAKLQNLGLEIRSKDNVSMTVVGHASTRVDGDVDPVRRKEINFAMAQKRANAVTLALKRAGVTPAWIEAISRGDDEATGNEATDRRADLYMR